MFNGSPTNSPLMGVGPGVEQYKASNGIIVRRLAQRELLNLSILLLEGWSRARKEIKHTLLEDVVASTGVQNGLDGCRELVETHQHVAVTRSSPGLRQFPAGM